MTDTDANAIIMFSMSGRRRVGRGRLLNAFATTTAEATWMARLTDNLRPPLRTSSDTTSQH
ncbi:hypothetical protein CAL25_14875 [Bordetella genomosp. 5]|uniref:Uncharacterized protein n=1 Tax=Bordetella genomosp. 5 TaxID=1395608 RepID=A0A261TI81_9BORD|nr:hypothetical protein CAL25_14875 [Bordetella genomosp. 5]